MGNIIDYDHGGEECPCAFIARKCNASCMALKFNAMGDPYCARVYAAEEAARALSKIATKNKEV